MATLARQQRRSATGGFRKLCSVSGIVAEWALASETLECSQPRAVEPVDLGRQRSHTPGWPTDPVMG